MHATQLFVTGQVYPMLISTLYKLIAKFVLKDVVFMFWHDIVYVELLYCVTNFELVCSWNKAAVVENEKKCRLYPSVPYVSVITGKQTASEDWNYITSMFVTSFSVYFVFGYWLCMPYMCMHYDCYLTFSGIRSGIFWWRQVGNRALKICVVTPHSRTCTSNCKENLQLSLSTNKILRGPTKSVATGNGMGQFGAAVLAMDVSAMDVLTMDVSAMDVSAMKCEMCFPLECHQSAKARTALVKRVGARFGLALVPIVQQWELFIQTCIHL